MQQLIDKTIMTINYTTFAVAAKLAARDILRTRWVANLLTERRNEEVALKGLDKEQKSYEKELAVAEFKATQAKTNGDPRAEDFAKDADEVKKAVTHAIDDLECSRKSHTRRIEEINKEIEDVTLGEKKVNHENMVTLAKELVQGRIAESFNEGEYDTAVDN